MNILLTTETYLPYITGVSVSTDSIAKYMVSQGNTVTLVCPKPLAKGSVKQVDDLTIVEVPSVPFTIYNLNATAIFPYALSVIGRLMASQKFDVVHIQEPGSVGVATLIKAKENKIPVVGALHFIPEQIDRVLWGGFEKIFTPIINIYIRFIYNKYDAIMTPSFFFASYLKSIGITKPIRVVSNGTDIQRFHPEPQNMSLRKKLGLSENDFVFFFLGRIDKDKNVETLVRAMKFTTPEVKLLVVGKGKEKQFLINLAGQLDVSEKIIWVDYISDAEMVDYYHAVDSFSIMSPYEGQSIVTLQAVATGLPIIAAKAGALPELCHDGENGFLVGAYNFRLLAEKMNKLAHNKNLQKKFGMESRQISLNHDKPLVLKNLELLYRELAEK